MRTYKIVTKKFFESEEKFENRLNEISSRGWKALSMSQNSSGVLSVLLEKE